MSPSMQISENLPQFEDRPSLFIVAGDQTARFFHVYNGTIEALDSFKIENPTYSDREGHFKRRAHGETYGSGSVREEDDTSVKNEFWSSLVDTLKEIHAEHDVEEIGLFAPPHSIKETESHIPTKYRGKIEYRITGNYTHQHPLEVLETFEKNR